MERNRGKRQQVEVDGGNSRKTLTSNGEPRNLANNGQKQRSVGSKDSSLKVIP